MGAKRLPQRLQKLESSVFSQLHVGQLTMVAASPPGQMI